MYNLVNIAKKRACGQTVLVIVSVSSYYFLMCVMVAQLECVHCRVGKGPPLSGLITPYADVRVPSRCH